MPATYFRIAARRSKTGDYNENPINIIKTFAELCRHSQR